ncbi:MAG: Uma2 family endonuclease [Myxococcaceae bacterium]
MGGKSEKPATYRDLVALPENVVGELIDGELFASPRPASPHARAASILGSELGGPFDRKPGEPPGPGGWWILYEPELHLVEDVLVPDLAGWRRERMPKMPDAAFFELPPDWVCEVVSPATARLDRAKKLPRYARAKVGHCWVVDPLARTLEVLRLEGERWALLGVFTEGDKVRAEPFEAIELDLARWWID